ncbi:unnamed protein product [Psylliodes chrysocephalus]|uniref:Gustatory receptor n=1 Tax=Psylliodes chrysocephalus TaxID=3402493 RepID=A0A9P0D2C9_9CUCU|nr:unnamed protein product [Psylliodes chrysocephala]
MRKTIKRLQVPIPGVLLISLSAIISSFIHILSINGLFYRSKSWKRFLDLVDKMEYISYVKINVAYQVTKFTIITFITVWAQLLAFRFLIQELSLASIFACVVYSKILLEGVFLTTLIWIVANMLSRRYCHLTEVLNITFLNKDQNKLFFHRSVLKIKNDLWLLHQVVEKLNELSGKIMWTMFAATFSVVLSNFNYVLFLSDSNTIGNVLEQCLPILAQNIVLMDNLTKLYKELNLKENLKDADFLYLQEYFETNCLNSRFSTRRHTYFGYLIPSITSLKTKLIKVKSSMTLNRSISLILEHIINRVNDRFKQYFDLTKTKAKDAIIAAATCPTIKFHRSLD